MLGRVRRCTFERADNYTNNRKFKINKKLNHINHNDIDALLIYRHYYYYYHYYYLSNIIFYLPGAWLNVSNFLTIHFKMQ